MSSRRPRLDANSSNASFTRDEPPVSTTMPSALRLRATSLVGICVANQTKPSAKATMARSRMNTAARPMLPNARAPKLRRSAVSSGRIDVAPSLLLDRVTDFALSSRPILQQSQSLITMVAISLIDGLQCAINRPPRRRGDQHGDDDNLNTDGNVAGR